MTARPDVSIVIPTIGRPCLERLLATLVSESVPCLITIVDDRVEADRPLVSLSGASQIRLLRSFGRGPAAACLTAAGPR